MSHAHKHTGIKREPEGPKIELDVVQAAQTAEEVSFSAVVKVNRPNYVPDYVRLRVRLSPEVFTAQVTPPALKLLEQDPLVVSISANKLLGNYPPVR